MGLRGADAVIGSTGRRGDVLLDTPKVDPSSNQREKADDSEE